MRFIIGGSGRNEQPRRLSSTPSLALPVIEIQKRQDQNHPHAPGQHRPQREPPNPHPTKGSGPNTNSQLSPRLTAFTTTIARKGVRVSPIARSECVAASITPSTGHIQHKIDRYSSAFAAAPSLSE